MPATAIRPTTIKIDQDTKERMKRLAEARHRTPHWMILEAIRQYVDREEKREAFRQDAINAWNEYRETGLHVTGEEADAWLAKLEAGQDVDPPECHV
jgi:predicted transcriptional regulator